MKKSWRTGRTLQMLIFQISAYFYRVTSAVMCSAIHHVYDSWTSKLWLLTDYAKTEVNLAVYANKTNVLSNSIGLLACLLTVVKLVFSLIVLSLFVCLPWATFHLFVEGGVNHLQNDQITKCDWSEPNCPVGVFVVSLFVMINGSLSGVCKMCSHHLEFTAPFDST